jgi:RNA recognition motif-containing protein
MENSQFDSKSTSSGQRTKLHVSNLPENCSRRQLTEFFNQYGQVLECSILWDSYAFIHYASLNEARNALKQASCTTFLGKRLTIQISTSRNRQTSDWYQQEAMKSMLNKSNDFLASLALVETKLHVTNLPDNCNQHELKSLFEQYGQVLECVIMWNHYAFVHFADFKEAQSAMKKLNGYEFHGRSLIIQFSTSHNRPLPKCQALNKSNASTNSSDIKASSKSTLDLTDTKDSSSKDWIKIIKAGALPVLNSLENREKMIPLQKSLLFTDNSNMQTLKSKQENISLDCVPTPPLPKPFQNVSARMSNTPGPISRSEPIAIQNDINIRSSFSLSENCKFEEDEFGMLCNLNLISMLKRCSVQSESAMFSHVSPAYSVDSGIELGQPSYDIDYLNSLCMYEENKILKSSSENSDMDAMPTSTNYILFPSLKEEHFSSKLEYDHAILQLLKKAYSN